MTVRAFIRKWITVELSDMVRDPNIGVRKPDEGSKKSIRLALRQVAAWNVDFSEKVLGIQR